MGFIGIVFVVFALLGIFGAVGGWWMIVGVAALLLPWAGAIMLQYILAEISPTRWLSGLIGLLAKVLAIIGPWGFAGGSLTDPIWRALAPLVQWPWRFGTTYAPVNDLFGPGGLFKMWGHLMANAMTASLDIGVELLVLAAGGYALFLIEFGMQRLVAMALGVRPSPPRSMDESFPYLRTAERPLLPGDRVVAISDSPFSPNTFTKEAMLSGQEGTVYGYNDDDRNYYLFIEVVQDGKPLPRLQTTRGSVRIADATPDVKAAIAALRGKQYPFVVGDRVFVGESPGHRTEWWRRGMATVVGYEWRDGWNGQRTVKMPYPLIHLDHVPKGQDWRTLVDKEAKITLVSGVEGDAGEDTGKLPFALPVGR